MYHDGLVSTPVPMPPSMKIPAAEAAVDEASEELQKLPHWDESKVRDKADRTLKAQAKQTPVHLVTLMDLCHLQHS